MNVSERWRLVLGQFAQKRLPDPLSGDAERMERALDFLYSREYDGRGSRSQDRSGTLDPSQLTVPSWLAEVRELFPGDVAEVIERHALQRYGMTELVTDKETLERLEPNMDLLRALITFRSQLQDDVLEAARRIIRTVVEELRNRLEPEIRRALTGRLNRFRHTPHKLGRNFDAHGTIRKNLKHYDSVQQRLLIQIPKFFQRNTHHLPWTIVLCVDQSGSMVSSVIHAAVMAGILAALPSVRLRLVVFDTSVVDLSDHVEDPVEVLMRVQLGGGTDIGQALRYCEGLIENPQRSVVVLISDFCEGASPIPLLGCCQRLHEGGVKLLGLAALDETATPQYDHAMAEKLADRGMRVAALTPNRFADWLSGVLHSK